MPSAIVIVTAVTSGLGFLLNSLVFYLVLSQKRRRHHYLFAGILAICAVWDLAIFLAMIRNQHLKEVAAYGYVMLPCTLLGVLIWHFTCCYLEQPRRKTTITLWSFNLLWLAVIIVASPRAIEGVHHYPWGNIFRPDLRFVNLLLPVMPIWYLSSLVPCWFLYQAYRRESSPVAQRHLLYILVSFLVINLATVKVIVTMGVEQGLVMTAGMLLTDISAAIIGVAILKDHLFDITPVIKIGLVYSGLLALVLFVFTFIEHMLTTYVAEQIGGHSTALHLVSIAATIAILMPVKRRFEHLVEGYFANKKLEF